MEKKQVSPELLQAELLPTQKEQIPPLQKRQIDSDDDAKPQTKRARTTQLTSKPVRLTRKNLALFDKMGQKKKKNSNPSDDSGSTKTISTTPPTNLDDIRKRYAAPRATASPPESVYEGYINRVEGAGNEATMVIETSGKLLKEYNDKGYSRAFNRSFTNALPNAGYNDGLSAPQPDFVEGLEKQEFRLFQVADHIPGATLYKDDPRSITLPQIAGEWKGPAEDMREARVQSAYDGAALVYVRNQALAYIGGSDPPGHAEITTFTTDGTNLNLYAHFAAPSEEDEDILEYHQYPILSMNLIGTYQGYKDGRRKLKDQLKEYWKQQRNSGPHPVAEEVPSLPAPGIEPLDVYEAYEDDGYE
ncbi:hypothetical protein B0T19DRAFT_448832 [Cercophora scortea]|uniref:Uncharacterized protein n=1 Tax=Cercophora scortea TaxID=314031 RepID=A0AAE0IY36_9PEZI|nr:hypothetical protein B0T19DRAFT_448832 [Cercophora scortea]